MAGEGIAEVRSQHVARMREEALRIQEFAGYVIARIDKGRADSVGPYAADIVSAGQRLMTGHATIEGLDVLEGKA
jgi:ribosomal protein L19